MANISCAKIANTVAGQFVAKMKMVLGSWLKFYVAIAALVKLSSTPSLISKWAIICVPKVQNEPTSKDWGRDPRCIHRDMKRRCLKEVRTDK